MATSYLWADEFDSYFDDGVLPDAHDDGYHSLKGLLEEKTPDVEKKWNDVPFNHQIRLSSDKARRELMSSLVREINGVNKTFVDEFGTNNPTHEQIVDLFFSERSPLFDLFKQLSPFGPDHDRFRKFLGTFFLCAGTKECSSRLLDCPSPPEWLNPKVWHSCLSNTDYIECWKELEKNGLASRTFRNYEEMHSRGTAPFWLTLQDTLNKLLKKYLIAPLGSEKINITIDDDKIHYSATGGGQALLKLTRHTRDNINGLVCNTAALTASGIVTGLRFDCLLDKGATDCTQKLISDMFLLGVGNIVFLMDRGYWTWELLSYLLVGGAMVLGTIKRLPWFPFTYDQVLNSEKDKRKLVPQAGIRQCYQRRFLSRQTDAASISGLAYRDGHGGVTLGITTETAECGRQSWELVLADPRDAEWYKSDADPDVLSKKWYRVVYYDRNAESATREACLDELQELCETIIDPLTTSSNNASWHMARRYSMTSSTADIGVNCLRRIKSVDHGACGIDTESLELVEAYLGMFEQGDDEEDGITDSRVLEIQDEVDVLFEDTANEETNLAEFREMLKPASGDKTALSSPELVTYYQSISGYCEIGAVANLTDANLVKRLHDWSNQERAARVFFLWSRDELIKECRARGLSANAKTPDKTLISRLAKDDNEKSQAGQRRDPKTTAQERLLRCVLARSLLKPLAGKQKEATKLGHFNETPILKSFIKELVADQNEAGEADQRNIPSVGHGIKMVVSPGIVRRKGDKMENAKKDSIDFLALTQNGEVVRSLGVEVKTRTNAHTQQKERDLVAHGPKYIHLRYNDPRLKRRIPSVHEACQILHHALIYDIGTVLLLVGDTKGNVIQGVFVDFPDSLIDAYDKILESMYALSLQWAYQTPAQKPVGFDRVAASLGLDSWDDFQMDVAIWHALQYSIPLPVPATARIIPYMFAYWNCFKSGSDTTTKLMDELRVVLPVKGQQAVAVARILLVIATTIFRMMQIVTATKRPQDYGTIGRWRNAASHRITFPEATKKIATILLRGNGGATNNDGHGAGDDDNQPDGEWEQEHEDGDENEDEDEGVTDAVDDDLEEDLLPEDTMRSSEDHVGQWDEWAVLQTGATPRAPKGRQKIYEAATPSLSRQQRSVKQRRKDCCGFPVVERFVCAPVGTKLKKRRGRCLLCKTRTTFFCLGCKEWFCLSPKPKELVGNGTLINVNLGQRERRKMLNGQRVRVLEEDIVTFFNSCFHKAHKTAVDEGMASNRILAARRLFEN